MANINVCAKYDSLPKRHFVNNARFNSVPDFALENADNGMDENPCCLFFLFKDYGGCNQRDGAADNHDGGLPSVKDKRKCHCVRLSDCVQENQPLWNQDMVGSGSSWQWCGHRYGANGKQTQDCTDAEMLGLRKGQDYGETHQEI